MAFSTNTIDFIGIIIASKPLIGSHILSVNDLISNFQCFSAEI